MMVGKFLLSVIILYHVYSKLIFGRENVPHFKRLFAAAVFVDQVAMAIYWSSLTVIY